MSWSEPLTRALPLLYALEERGFETVFVGGCVRDTLLGKPLKDVDIATAASPEQVMAIFPHTIPTGLQHGTVTVVAEGETYELTTFRTESAYEQHRRPTEVQFVNSLEADLLRRDFTINSMALRSDGTLVDPFGGLQDLRNGILRCVGDPDARLQEDALRLVRAIRFAAAYDLRIAHRTWRAIKRHNHLLVHIAMERIGLEFDKMIAVSDPQRAAAWLAASGMLSFTKEALPEAMTAAVDAYMQARMERASASLPENIHEAYVRRPGWPMAAMMQQLGKVGEPEDRWAALCAALSMDTALASEMFAALKYATLRSIRLVGVLEIHIAMKQALLGMCDDEQIDPHTRSTWRQEMHREWISLILRHGKPAAKCWIQLIRNIPMLAEPSAEDCPIEQLPKLLDMLQQSLDKLPAASLKELAVKGKDILGLQVKPSGPWLGILLAELLLETALGELPNEKEHLLSEVAKRLAAITG
ncbi:CCA tRNA nucleotidyltransferase [Paenibacillus sp. R14(2021)]|uniref:CCA tRNA nucleotidyltransferase n=1 Tax=Paenibacillus sp. R14(2021) TaxID=2859228 RepID=UPI001C616448|nr:CCA tRNA nucleotidyltransferase [Paenibacillus sp. R14(2021)]